jgi:hypothetical protein
VSFLRRSFDEELSCARRGLRFAFAPVTISQQQMIPGSCVMGFGETPIGLVSQILNLAGVLTRKGGLKVPRYQRPYTWTEREVRELIRDLWGAYERKAPFYFIGQIVLIKNTRGKYEISDGQQRLATTIACLGARSIISN